MKVQNRSGDAQNLQHALVVDRARDEFAAHRVELGGGRLDVLFDLLQREGVIGALVPVPLAIDRMERESRGLGLFAPVRPLVARNALHQLPDEIPCPVVPKPPRAVDELVDVDTAPTRPPVFVPVSAVETEEDGWLVDAVRFERQLQSPHER